MVHPLLSEAVVRFQSENITETFPAVGPVRTRVEGKPSLEKDKAAQRVQSDMNWRLTQTMPEFRTEHERMLFNLPVAGSAFKKVYFDSYLGRPVSRFVPAEDFVISYGSSDLVTAERYSCRMRYTENEVKAAIAAGFYRDIDIGTPGRRKDELQDAKDRQTGARNLEDDRYEFVEMHVDLVNYGLGTVENEVEVAQPCGDVQPRDRRDHVGLPQPGTRRTRSACASSTSCTTPYVPGFGFWLRPAAPRGRPRAGGDVADAPADRCGHAVEPAGRPEGQGAADQGRRHADRPGRVARRGGHRRQALRRPVPDPVQGAVGGSAEPAGPRGGGWPPAASTADTKLADMTGNTPVGTTLAVLERTLKVMSAVQARVHAALSTELKLLKALVRDTTPAEYPIDADPRARSSSRTTTSSRSCRCRTRTRPPWRSAWFSRPCSSWRRRRRRSTTRRSCTATCCARSAFVTPSA